MSDDKQYTEQDLILAKREAFRAGAYWGIEHSPRQDALVVSPVVAEAESRYPLPRLTRARVVKDPVSMNGREWRCVGGLMETRLPYAVPCEEREWHRVDVLSTHRDFVEHSPPPAPERVAMWADLLANPTETCPDE